MIGVESILPASPLPLLPLVLLYTRLGVDDVLRQDARRRTLDYFRANPGATVGEAAGALGVDFKTARYHVRVLAGFGLLRETKEGRSVRVAPAGHRKP